MIQTDPFWRCGVCECANVADECAACRARRPVTITITDMHLNYPERPTTIRMTAGFDVPSLWSDHRLKVRPRKSSFGLSPAERENRIAAAKRQGAARKATKRYAR